MFQYEFGQVEIDDEKVAEHEREIKQNLSISVEEGHPDNLYLEGKLDEELYNDLDSSESLAFGTALGEYVFEELTDFENWLAYDSQDLPVHIPTDDPMYQRVMDELGVDVDDEYFEEGFVNQREVSEELDLYSFKRPEELDRNEKLILENTTEIFEAFDDDPRASEISELCDPKDGEVDIGRKSAGHRSWITEQLNSLNENGFIGRYKDGHKVKYVENPEEGFKKHLGESKVEELEEDLAYSIINEGEGIIPPSVRRSLKHKQSDRIIEEFTQRASWKALNT